MTQHFGWIDRQDEVSRIVQGLPFPTFSQAAPHLMGTGDGKTALLYEAVRKVWGRDHDPGPQLIGDCVSWAYAGCVDTLACLQVTLGKAEEHSWDLRTHTEAVYALSRVEYGNLDGSYEDGSVGAWAAAAVSKGGTLSRKRLGEYDPKRAKDWGAKGLPDELEPEAREHLVKTVSLVRSWDELKAALANGYPIAVCSMQGFVEVRDSRGFCRPQGQWAHAMKFLAYRDDDTPGALCCQSWGPEGHPSGPLGDIQIPSNSWWVDPNTVNRMLRQQDSFCLSNFVGYKKQVDDLIPWVFK